jgi:hypothetical protein
MEAHAEGLEGRPHRAEVLATFRQMYACREIDFTPRILTDYALRDNLAFPISRFFSSTLAGIRSSSHGRYEEEALSFPAASGGGFCSLQMLLPRSKPEANL